MSLKFETRGAWSATFAYLNRQNSDRALAVLEKYGPIGVSALRSVTPVDSSATAAAWTYEVKKGGGKFSIHWSNTNEVAGMPIVMMLQYGHGTGTGGYVAGRDFINPAIRPIFDQMVADAMREVTR